ncbi:hypothetical protein M405DRAFT_116907 [Rhizopogon salebrosus TDB-379]|nr:hypothetical protein M405DRAFT_116907 [Rhizopogon salebrosus TDB-379]
MSPKYSSPLALLPPVSVHFDPDLPRSVVSPSVAAALGHSSMAGVFSEVITTACQGRGLTDIAFGVSSSFEVDVHLGLDWLSAWHQVGHDTGRLAPAPNPYNVELGHDHNPQSANVSEIHYRPSSSPVVHHLPREWSCMRRALTAYCTVIHIAHLQPLLSCLPGPAFAMLHRCALRITSPPCRVLRCLWRYRLFHSLLIVEV